MKVNLKMKCGMAALVTFMLLMMLVSCSKKITQDGDTIKVYFCDTVKGTLFSEDVSFQLKNGGDHREQVQFIIDAVVKGPQAANLQTNISLPIKKVNFNEKLDLVYILFDKQYYNLSSQEQMGIRSSLTYSLTELSFIKGVEFFVEDMPIANTMGEPIGVVTRHDIVLDVLDPNPPTTIQTVTLYFLSADGKKLAKEQRDIQVNNSVALEKYVVDELIKGPKEEGLLPTIPPKETFINDVSTKEGVCQVDLSFDLKSKHFTTPESKTFMIYSIVNSLTELPQIQKVAFLVNGKKEVEFSKDIDLSEFFERKEALIE